MNSRSKRYRCIYLSRAIKSESQLVSEDISRSVGQCLDVGGKCYVTVRRKYDIRALGS